MEDPLAGYGAGEDQAKPASKDRPDNPHFFRWLCYGEFALVSLIMLGVIALVIYSIGWVTCGWRPEIHSRIVEAINGLNTNWKVGFLVLFPLFFRPLAKFLINLKKAHGWESGDQVIGQQSSAKDYGSQ